MEFVRGFSFVVDHFKWDDDLLPSSQDGIDDFGGWGLSSGGLAMKLGLAIEDDQFN